MDFFNCRGTQRKERAENRKGKEEITIKKISAALCGLSLRLSAFKFSSSWIFLTAKERKERAENRKEKEMRN